MEEKENNRCVYTHTRPDTNTIFYVGAGTLERSRSKAMRNPKWTEIVSLNKGIFIVDIVCNNQSWESVSQMEIALINFYGREDKGEGQLCNMTDGGVGANGLIYSDIHRYKIGKAGKGRAVSEVTRERMRASMIGKICSDETKSKIGEANSGRVQSREAIEKRSLKMRGKKKTPVQLKEMTVNRIMKNGYFIERICRKTGEVLGSYRSLIEAEKETGINRTTIAKVCKNALNHAGGFVWRKSFDKDLLSKIILQIQVGN